MEYFVKLNGSTLDSFDTIEAARKCMFANDGACIDIQKDSKPSWDTCYSMHLGEGCSHVQACEMADNDCAHGQYLSA